MPTCTEMIISIVIDALEQSFSARKMSVSKKVP